MKKNIGSSDKVIRAILGIVLIIVGIIFQSWWGLIGIIPLFTALIGTCPAYMACGVSTANKSKTADV